MTAAAGSGAAELAPALSPSCPTRARELPIFSGRSAITEAASRSLALPRPSPPRLAWAAATHLPRWGSEENPQGKRPGSAGVFGQLGGSAELAAACTSCCLLRRTPGSSLDRAVGDGPAGRPSHPLLPVMAPAEAPARCPHLAGGMLAGSTFLPRPPSRPRVVWSPRASPRLGTAVPEGHCPAVPGGGAGTGRWEAPSTEVERACAPSPPVHSLSPPA